jgi:hypothetical protein
MADLSVGKAGQFAISLLGVWRIFRIFPGGRFGRPAQVAGQFGGFPRNPKRKRGAITNPLAYASGYDWHAHHGNH